MNTLLTRLAATAVCALGISAGSLSAQINNQLLAKIPFPFEVKGQNFEAGKYRIATLTNSRVITLSNVDNTERFVLGTLKEDEVTKGTAHLTFHRYGSDYFLAEVWGSEKRLRKLAESPHEREIRTGRDVKTAAITVLVKMGTGS